MKEVESGLLNDLLRLSDLGLVLICSYHSCEIEQCERVNVHKRKISLYRSLTEWLCRESELLRSYDFTTV